MSTNVVDHLQTEATPQKIEAKQHPIDKFTETRMAKKKAKRARHRAKLKRSHTDG